MVWRNLWHRRLGALVNLILLALGTGIISLLLLLQGQVEEKFQNDLRGVDLVIGAKGSPLQLVLSAVYQIDAPTGNVPIAAVKPILQGPMVSTAIPLAYGDSYRGYRIVGTSTAFAERFEAKLAEGRDWSAPLEVLLGAGVARATGLELGAQFHGNHGVAGGEAHDHHDFIVVGILEPSNSVLDQLILTDPSSVWMVHDQPVPVPPIAEERHGALENAEAAERQNGLATHHGQDDRGHHHEHDHEQDYDHQGERSIQNLIDWQNPTDWPESLDLTAVLVQFRGRMGMFQLPGLVNKTQGLQAALPSVEVNRLIGLLGIGTTTLQVVGSGITIMAGISVFLALFLRLRERRRELALLRAMGHRPSALFTLLLGEGLFLAGIGAVLGLLLSRLGLILVNRLAAGEFHWSFSAQPIAEEAVLLGGVLALGVLAALVPALLAMRVDVAKALAED
jgi:putative ABC transport system permease protein